MMNAPLSRIEGVGLSLRLVEPGDAAYIHGLRTDPSYNEHLSPVSGNVEDQRRWIEAYKAREAAGTEYYFVFERKDGIRCGVVRLYDITDGRFTWGSWILDHNKPFKAALESAVLIYQLAFDRLNLARAIFDVRRENERTLSFHKRFGACQTGEDTDNFYFEYTRQSFAADLPRHRRALKWVEDA